MDWIFGFGAGLLDQFLDPGKRLFLGYLASALLIALVWAIFILR